MGFACMLSVRRLRRLASDYAVAELRERDSNSGCIRARSFMRLTDVGGSAVTLCSQPCHSGGTNDESTS